MDSLRLLTVQVELDLRRLGGSALLIPFDDAWLESNPCRQLLKHVLDEQLDESDVLVAADEVKMSPRCIYSLSAVSHIKPPLLPTSSNDTSTETPVATYQEVQE